ncbi:hypothetical protein ABZ656_05105 [Streptomyces sp. NPDC007095]
MPVRLAEDLKRLLDVGDAAGGEILQHELCVVVAEEPLEEVDE